MFVSGAESRRIRIEDPRNKTWIASKGVRVLSRNMALLPLPVMHPNEGGVDREPLTKAAWWRITRLQRTCMCASVMRSGIEDSRED